MPKGDMKMPMKYLTTAALLLVSACSGNGTEPIDNQQPPQVTAGDCPVHSATDVNMWINAMPGPNDNPTLLTTFKVTAPTPGYEFGLKVLEERESFPPQYVFELVTRPPDGITTQVETETDVRIELPKFPYDQVASATVKCAGNTLFTTDSIETAY